MKETFNFQLSIFNCQRAGIDPRNKKNLQGDKIRCTRDEIHSLRKSTESARGRLFVPREIKFITYGIKPVIREKNKNPTLYKIHHPGDKKNLLGGFFSNLCEKK
jgi:hypothetical protein